MLNATLNTTYNIQPTTYYILDALYYMLCAMHYIVLLSRRLEHPDRKLPWALPCQIGNIQIDVYSRVSVYSFGFSGS